MRIAFDVSPLSHTRTGVPNYIRGSLMGLVAAAGERHEIVAFSPASVRGRRAIEEALRGIAVRRTLPVLPFAHAWRTAWSRAGRPAAERFLGRFDVLQFWDWMYPPQRGGIRATMIHDLVPLHFPQWVTEKTRRMHEAKYENAARTCDLVFVNSTFTANDVERLLGVPRARIRIAPPGVDERYRPDGESAGLGRPYALTVATLEPRKNLDTLVRAQRLLDGKLALAVAGGEGWGAQPALDELGVVRLGFVPTERLAPVYRGASVYVTAASFEGFGMTVVEAMASGVPCVVSSHPSLDDACGDAAVRVDPGSAESIARGIERALAEREELVRRGLEHARRFPWDGTGRAFLAGFERALAGRSG